MDILNEIVKKKREEVKLLKKELPLSLLLEQSSDSPQRGFLRALSQPDAVNIIAEIKKGSPSRGIMIDKFDPQTLAWQYQSGGACCLSVLTDQKYFFGHADNIRLAKEKTSLPALCKDFLLEPYQLHYAHYIQADAVLLIARLHSPGSLAEMLATADDLGMDSLVEIHDESELELAIEAGATIIGVNNRNLKDFTVSLATAERLAKSIPENVVRVAESGIFTRSDIERLQRAGFNCFLIGEALVRSADPVALLKELRGA
ncbi:MAG: indole-3-glycerol phosphate synthase TrpC [Candidatus Zixiibacteriota bacterium]